jgi:hypothetical protein
VTKGPQVNDRVKTFSWRKWLRGRVSAVHDDDTCTIEWIGGGVSTNATVVNGIVPRQR